MHKNHLISILSLAMVLFAGTEVFAQTDYVKVLQGRSEKIVSTLGISDTVKFIRIRDILVNQYSSLGKIHDAADLRIKDIKSSAETATVKDSLVKIVENGRDANLYKLHCSFIAALYGNLDHNQVESVKNGMTYDVLNVTYKAQIEMIPSLKDDEKQQIYIWLLEAREHAMDAQSSNKKHEWFGKYKGRINNYLSAKGYDLKKEREQWYKRIEEQKKSAK
jgi:hypothetical protein